MATLAAPHDSASPRDWRQQAPLYLAGAAAALPTVSIAGYQIVLGAAIIALFFNREKLRWPPATLPLLCFLGWTLLSWAASPDLHRGLPQVKKIYVFAMLIVVFSALRTMQHVRAVAWAWIAGTTLSSLWAFGQGVRMYLATPRFFYNVYSNQGRITGFMDHWMTFSGLIMMALLITMAWLLYGNFREPGPASQPRKIIPIVLSAAVFILGLALLAGYQRTMWAGATIGAIWLLWSKNKWLVLTVPVLAGVLLASNIFDVRERVLSVIQPQPGVGDSSSHRAGLRATGWEMIKAHPLLGVGPEQIEPQFLNYAPPSVPRPIPTAWFIGHLHNIYYQYAAERGVPALAFMLWFLGRCLWDFSLALKRPVSGDDPHWMLRGAIAAIIAMMVAGYGEFNLGDSEPLGMFLAVIACGYVARDVGILHDSRRSIPLAD